MLFDYILSEPNKYYGRMIVDHIPVFYGVAKRTNVPVVRHITYYDIIMWNKCFGNIEILADRSE